MIEPDANNSMFLPLHPKQLVAFHSPAQQILYGGAAGGGKSYLARVMSIFFCTQIEGFQMYLFRRHYKDLYLAHFTGKENFNEMLAPMIKKGLCKITKMEISFANGSKIHGCHCQHVQDVYQYKSVEMHGLIPEEATEFDPFQLQYLATRQRYPKSLKVPEHLKSRLPYTLYPTNPGGDSHDMLLEDFRVLDFYEKGKVNNPSPVFDVYVNPKSKKSRQFIPALLSDNPSLDEDEYIASLGQLRNPEILASLLHGDWTVKLGSLLSELNVYDHVCKHFEPPDYWPRVGAFDWGATSPAAVIWVAIADGEHGGLARGCRYVYREWLVADEKDKTKGLGLSNVELAKGIKQREDNSNIHYLTDSLPFQERGGIPMWQEFSDQGVILSKADVSSKEVSVQALRSLLIHKPKPLFAISEECPDLYRTLKLIRPHPKNPEKPADHPEDHLPDCALHIARAWLSVQDDPKAQANKGVKIEIKTPTLNNITGLNFEI